MREDEGLVEVEVEVEVEGDVSSRAGVSTWVVVNREVEGEGLR